MTKQDQESKETVDATSSKHSREPSFDEKVVQGIETASEPPKEKSKADAVEAEYEVESQETKENRPSFYQRHRKWMHLAMFLIFTGYLAAAFALQVPKGYNQENLVLGLIYAFFVLYILFSHVPITILTKPFLRAVSLVGAPIRRLRPMYQKILYVGFVAVVIIVVAFSIPPSAHSTRVQRLIGLFGLVVFVAGLYATSHNRRAINWNTVAGGLLIQFILGIFVFRTSAGHDMFQWLANFAQGYLAKSSYGAAFVFSDDIASSGMFVVNIVPPIILFCATAQILYYVGALSWVLRNAANIFIRLLGVSGAEAVVACSTCFLGQVESAMLVKPLLPNFTKAEMHQILTCGFATISGSTLFAYISMGVDGQALITSSIMSIPCSLAVSKLRWPETDEPETKTNAVVAKDKESRNLLHAAGIGAGLGINIGLLIIANLIAILALLHVVDAFLTWAGNFLTIQNLTLELITSYIFVPLAWLIGADNHNVVQVGELMATKLWANEFVAYTTMTTTYADILTERSRLVATYALCGFANLGSVGIQVGGLTMMAPSRAADISKLAVSALICGSLSTYISACIAGMLF